MGHQGTLQGQDFVFYTDDVLGTDSANSSVRRIKCIGYEDFTLQD